MNRKIYTYTDLSELPKNKPFQEIKSYPIITVSADLRKSLKGKADIDCVQGIFSSNADVIVTEFGSLAEAIDNEWNTDQNKFNMMILISEYFNKRIRLAENIKNECKWLTGCMRNMDCILSAIMLLEQAGVTPEDMIPEGDRNLEIFNDVWNYVLKNDSSIRKFHARMKQLDKKDSWSNILNKAFKRADLDSFDTIVFLGFYYITPYQERVMRMLEKVGYNLVFLIPYDERYPFIYEIWDETYSEKRGYPCKEEWHIDRCDKTDEYGDLFDGKKVKLSNRLTVREYASVMEFVDDVKHIKEMGYAIYSSDYQSANTILKDYFPEEYGERKVLSYPIGQFISNLNQMWDSAEEKIVLEEEKLIECFSSGWLSIDGVSGKQYMQDLFYILPFFTGCKELDEWKNRIDLLKKMNEEAVDSFEVEKDLEESVSRWQEAIGNPLNNFSMFAVQPEKLDVILNLILQLLDMAKALFGKNEPIPVQLHIEKLDHILKMHEISDEMYEEEMEIVTEIFERLNQPGTAVSKCYPGDISNALSLYICGRFDEGEIQTNQVGLVYPLYFVDAACVKNHGKVHVCMCDVENMPGKSKDYIWPLSGEQVRKIYAKTKNTLILNMIDVMEKNILCNRYFMYRALKNKDVSLSWISCINEKLLAPSPYIKMIFTATGIELDKAKRNLITYKRIEETPLVDGKIESYERSKTPQGVIKEARMDYALCPMKYVLGYVLEKYPTYQSEFQQNYALNALISAIYNLMKEEGMSVSQVYKAVVSLFPNMRKIEKRQVYDYISYDRREDDLDYRNRTSCGGRFYTDERLKLHYPNQKVRKAVIERFGKLMTPDGRQGMDLYEVMDEIKDACTFCPHINYCKNAIFSVDQESYYE